MSKEIYISPEITIKQFCGNDIITASESTTTREPNKPIELPFVPAEIN